MTFEEYMSSNSGFGNFTVEELFYETSSDPKDAKAWLETVWAKAYKAGEWDTKVKMGMPT